MALLFVFFILFLINAFSARTQGPKDKTGFAGTGVVVENISKNCPPHKWQYVEVRDTEGNTVKWKIVCDLCGPLRPQTGPARVE